MRKLLVVCLILLAAACKGPAGQYVQISGFAQGGNYSIKLNMKGVELPVENVRDSICAILDSIDFTLSGYNKKSLLSRFNAGQPIRPNALFLDMYRMGYALWERSGGVLDFGAAPLYDAWGFGFKNSAFPTEQEIRELQARCGMAHMPGELPVEDGMLDPARMNFPKLNYNAVAQGYSCDLVARFLYSLGVKDMLVDIGEIWCDGVGPGKRPWTVGVQRPEEGESHELEGVWQSSGSPLGVVTSGNYRKFYVKDGRKYAHTIDPRSGYPVQHGLLSATVVSAQSAAEADALATWCMVVGLEEARKLIMEDSALEGYLIYTDDQGQMQEWSSPGFNLVDHL